MNFMKSRTSGFFKKNTRFLLTVSMLCVLTVVVPFFVFAEAIYSDDSYTATCEDGKWTYDPDKDAYNGSVISTGCNSNTQVSGTLTLTYQGTEDATITFDYTLSENIGSFTIDGSDYSQNASFSKTLKSDNKAVVIVLTSKQNNSSEATATIKNLNISIDSDITVTFAPVAGISYTVNNNSVAPDGEGYTVKAPNTTAHTISSGTTADNKTVYFAKANLEWTDNNGNTQTKTVYPNADGEITPTEEGTTITPVFVVDDNENGKAPFKFGDKYYWTWDDAFTVADGTGIVILNDDYTLLGREDAYEVPAGVTFLVPFDDNNTLYQVTPEHVINAYATPEAYRTLTIADGATVTVNGEMSVSAKVNASSSKINEGSPTGNVGMIKMQGSSLMDVYGTLYCWGYITGSGSVNAYGGATVYECFQFMDHRGGSQSTSMSNKIFPISQYYVQNIEVPLTLYAGATEHAYTVLYTGSATKTSNISFIGDSSSMFTLANGSVTKEYDGSTDRLIIDVDGNVSLSAITMDLGGTWGAISSGSYVLPLNSNMTINIKSGTATINQDLALLPCTQINIYAGANCVLGSGKSVYVYDVDQWEEFVYAENSYGYSYNKDGTYHNLRLRALTYAPGRADDVNRETQGMVDAAVCVNGTLDARSGYLYTTAGPMLYAETTDHTKGEIYPNHYSTAISPTDGPKDTNVNPDCNVAGNTVSGANIYSTVSTGLVLITSGTATATYQIIQDPYHYDTWLGEETDGDYYISIPVTSAQLLNEVYNDNELPMYTTTTSSNSTTYNYSAECGRWFAGEHDAVEEGSHVCVCGAIRRVSIYGTSVRAGDSLGMYFYVEKGALVAASGDTTDGTYYAIVEHQKNGEDNTVEKPNQLVGELYENTYYRFYFPGVAAKEMADELEVTIYWYNGTEYVPISMDYTESVQKYAMDLLNSISDDTTDDTEKALRTVLVDMLNYGAACQIEHVHNTADLANALLTDTQQLFATSSNPECEAVIEKGNYYLTHTVSTKSNLMYTLYFKDLPSGVTKAKITYTDHYGNPVTRNADVVSTGNTNEYRVDVTGLAIADRSQQITCDLLDSTNNVVSTTVGSIEAYVKEAREYNLAVGACNALMKFAKSAYEYFRLVENT